MIDKDPKAFERAALYEELGIVTVSSTDWAMQGPRLPGTPGPKGETSFGRGEVSLLRLELPQRLVDRSVGDLEQGAACGW